MPAPHCPFHCRAAAGPSCLLLRRLRARRPGARAVPPARLSPCSRGRRCSLTLAEAVLHACAALCCVGQPALSQSEQRCGHTHTGAPAVHPTPRRLPVQGPLTAPLRHPKPQLAAPKFMLQGGSLAPGSLAHPRGGCRRRAHGGYATRRGQCPRTRQRSGGRPWPSRRTPGARSWPCGCARSERCPTGWEQRTRRAAPPAGRAARAGGGRARWAASSAAAAGGCRRHAGGTILLLQKANTLQGCCTEAGCKSAAACLPPPAAGQTPPAGACLRPSDRERDALLIA